MKRILDWLFSGLSFGDWTWYPDPWRVWARQYPELASRMSEFKRKRKHGR